MAGGFTPEQEALFDTIAPEWRSRGFDYLRQKIGEHNDSILDLMNDLHQLQADTADTNRKDRNAAHEGDGPSLPD